MKYLKKLSIIIVNYNTNTFLISCLKSIYESSLNLRNFEVIIVDNNSSDTSVSSLNKYFPQVKLISNTQNNGFARANNQGIHKSVGEYILLLNPDTKLYKYTLEKTIHFMDKNRNTAIATCAVLLSSGQLDDACHRGFPTPWNAFCAFTGLGSLFSHNAFFNGYHLGYQHMNEIHEIDSCAGAFMMIRKIAGKEIHWLDEDYFWYGEDLDFCYRMKQKGWKVMYFPNVSILHHKGVSSGIKKHSRSISSADTHTKLTATYARYQVMRIFYEKYYSKKYPSFVTGLVKWAITIKEKISIFVLR